MNNAERRAFERYPDYREMDGEYVTQIHKRKVFAEGYHQAEKDLELTWEDMRDIYNLAYNLRFPHKKQKEFFEEVLKRFKNLKK